jgi:hypothetical protein
MAAGFFSIVGGSTICAFINCRMGAGKRNSSRNVANVFSSAIGADQLVPLDGILDTKSRLIRLRC